MRKLIKVVVEKNPDGYVAYPIGMNGAVVAQGDTFDEAVQEVCSAIRFHIEAFGNEIKDDQKNHFSVISVIV